MRALTQPERARELDQLRNDAEYMRFLLAAGDLLGSSLDYGATLRNVAEAAARTVADICIVTIGASASEAQVAAAVHRDDALNFEVQTAGNHLRSEPDRPAHPILQVLHTGRTFFTPAIDKAWIAAHASSKEHGEFMRRLNYRSMIIVPIRSQVWGMMGALSLIRTDMSSHAYDAGAVPFAEDLGRRCGIAIAKAKLHTQTIDIARRLQTAALPRTLPQLETVAFDAIYDPADRAVSVGGDWYDAFELENGSVGISIGDVSGHGIEAAARMSSIRDALRMAMIIERDLATVLNRADFLFRSEAPEGIFCTALIAVLDCESERLTFASAGHPGPMIWSNGSLSEPLQASQPPLGFGDLTSQRIEPSCVRLESGSTIVFYTDGLIEWQRSYIEGHAALRLALGDPRVRQASHPARAIRERCVRGPHTDDIAVLVASLR